MGHEIIFVNLDGPQCIFWVTGWAIKQIYPFCTHVINIHLSQNINNVQNKERNSYVVINLHSN